MSRPGGRLGVPWSGKPTAWQPQQRAAGILPAELALNSRRFNLQQLDAHRGHEPTIGAPVSDPVLRFMGRRFPGWQLTSALLLLLFNFGCHTVVPLPPFDLGQPGWNIRQGQALWRAKADAPEIAGELLVATQADGRSFLQFTKTPLPFVVAQTTSNSWQIEFTPEDRRYSGPGTPPSRIVWFQLVRGLRGGLPGQGWTFTAKPDNRWTVENVRTGEILEGYLAPAPARAHP